MYEFRLYITGQTSKSEKAIMDFKSFLEEKLKGEYSLRVIDVLEDPEVAKYDKIFVTPTVVKVLPLPVRKAIGVFSGKEKELELLLLY
jgi:circadian clock protein KaiB